ncbi:hypothetical protein AKJ16_DCAP23838 [Drosera capensis]
MVCRGGLPHFSRGGVGDGDPCSHFRANVCWNRVESVWGSGSLCKLGGAFRSMANAVIAGRLPVLDAHGGTLRSTLHQRRFTLERTQLLRTTLAVKELVQSEFQKVEEVVLSRHQLLASPVTLGDFFWALTILRTTMAMKELVQSEFQKIEAPQADMSMKAQIKCAGHNLISSPRAVLHSLAFSDNKEINTPEAAMEKVGHLSDIESSPQISPSPVPCHVKYCKNLSGTSKLLYISSKMDEVLVFLPSHKDFLDAEAFCTLVEEKLEDNLSLSYSRATGPASLLPGSSISAMVLAFYVRIELLCFLDRQWSWDPRYATGLQIPSALDELYQCDGAPGAIFTKESIALHLCAPLLNATDLTVPSDIRGGYLAFTCQADHT